MKIQLLKSSAVYRGSNAAPTCSLALLLHFLKKNESKSSDFIFKEQFCFVIISSVHIWWTCEKLVVILSLFISEF